MQWYLVLLWLLCVTLVTSLEVGEDYAIRREDQEWLNSLFYVPSTPRVRREYRMLSEEERNVFHNAFIKMKRDRSVQPNKHDLLASLHARRSVRNSAHRGTGFLAWHRVYLLLFENGLREQEPDLTMPYWDCTLDSSLELPRESSLFNEDFMGNGDGYVTTGVFKDWGVQSGRLYRTVGALHRPLGDHNISHMLEQRHLANITYPLYGKDMENVFELIHNRVHHWIGGEMKAIETAADDPIFQPYHSFVSLIWEEFRTRQKQQGIDPETDWSDFYGQGRHHRYSPMGLGNLMAIDGASEVFAQNIVFDKRPTCSQENVDCGTPYLYCNVTLNKCVPWTIREYDLIKSKANEMSKKFKDVADQFLKSKIKKGYQQLISSGFAKEKLPSTAMIYLVDNVEDMFKELELTPIVYENKPDNASIFDVNSNFFGENSDSHDHNHDHKAPGNDHEDNLNQNAPEVTVDTYTDSSDDVFSHSGHMHGDGDHMHEGTRHEQKIIDQTRVIKREKYPIEEFLDKYGLMLFAGLIIFRAGFALIMKCSSDKCCSSGCSSNRQRYHMDGIVNVNFDEDRNKGPDGDTNRTDNIYTVTVTANSQDEEINGTFVRFAKLETLQRNGALNASTSTQEAGDRISNYLDMTYASHYAQQPELGESPGVSDVYEQETTENDQESVDDYDERYNSIENENFDFIRAAITEAGESVSESDSYNSDLFDTYDNVMNVAYVKEAPTPCVSGKPTPSPRVRRNVDAKLEHEDGYIQYMPGTHM